MKRTAKAPANIAFIKYWGKTNTELRLPANASISMNLSGALTTTTVEFSDDFDRDVVTCIDAAFTQHEQEKVIAHIDRIRSIAKIQTKAKVATKNSFPKGVGAASSASGFAALTVAGCSAAGLSISEKDLSVLARIGSGSACRSIPDGFVKWVTGTTSEESFAYSLYPSDYWDLCDILVIAESGQKSVSSTVGMEAAATSPFWENRFRTLPKRMQRVEKALAEKNFWMLGEAIEEDSLDMHYVMQTQTPPMYYWNEKTKDIMEAVKYWRSAGLAVYFTIDAGPNVHLICEAKDKTRVLENLAGYHVIVNQPSKGAHLIDDHLF